MKKKNNNNDNVNISIGKVVYSIVQLLNNYPELFGSIKSIKID